MGIAAQYVHGAKVCFIPRPENNWRPLALQHRSLAVISFLLLLAKALALGLVALMPVPAELSTITTARIVQLANQERSKAGLGTLKVNDSLSQAAAAKAADMLQHDYFAHISPSGVTPWFWINKAGYAYRLAGENLAIDFTQAEDVVAAWMASPSHRENILQAGYAETGVGVLTGEFEGATSIVVVHLFGQAADAAPVSPSESAPAPAAAPAAPPPAVVPAADTTAPIAPSITLTGGSDVGRTLQAGITGEANSLVTFLVNNQERGAVRLSGFGSGDLTVELNDIPDGDIVIKASATDAAGNHSEWSTPQLAHKDTEGPTITAGTVTFLVSPATDDPQALVRITTGDVAAFVVSSADAKQTFPAGAVAVMPLAARAATLTLTDHRGNASTLGDVALLPAFSAEADTSYLASPARFSGGVRKMTLLTGLTIALLLTGAVLIKIRVQHPGMIMHAVFVLALAAALLAF